MNNKGFTLIELLAVIVILVSISLIVVSSYSSSLQRREEKECEEQIALVKNAAKIYFSLTDNTSITIRELKENGYFDDANKVDKLNANATVAFNGNEDVLSDESCSS